jgi:hypothetical protein
MLFPAMLDTTPARKTVAHIVNIPQIGLIGLGFHFVALANRTNAIIAINSTTKAPPTVIIGFIARVKSSKGSPMSVRVFGAVVIDPHAGVTPQQAGVTPPY